MIQDYHVKENDENLITCRIEMQGEHRAIKYTGKHFLALQKAIGFILMMLNDVAENKYSGKRDTSCDWKNDKMLLKCLRKMKNQKHVLVFQLEKHTMKDQGILQICMLTVQVFLMVKLMQKDNITLLCHRRPDGDTVGSAFALYYALKELGKEVRVLCADALPKQYDYLYGDYTPSRILDWPVEYVVTVDVATAGMLGGLEEKYGHMVDLCIDHHPSNSDYAAQTCLWQEAGACAEPVAAVIKAIGLPVSGKIAECVYNGLVTDTGGFRFSNTAAGTLRLAAEIMESGVDTAAINTRVFESESKAKMLAEAKMMSSLEFYAGDRIAVMPVTLAMRAQTGVTGEELEDVAGIPRKIEGVLLGITIKEHEGECHISLRSKEPVNADEIAEIFGGGGHRLAAGITIKGTVEETARLLVAEAVKHLPKEQA